MGGSVSRMEGGPRRRWEKLTRRLWLLDGRMTSGLLACRMDELARELFDSYRRVVLEAPFLRGVGV